jgi:hypothetical protein
MDESAHVLRFRCVNDACEPQERKVEAGVTEARLSITMKIRPAFLVVEGEPALTYQVLEEPGVLMRSGVRVPVPMNASRRRMTVQELPSGRSRQVLVQAGEVATVRFLGEAQEGMEKP